DFRPEDFLLRRHAPGSVTCGVGHPRGPSGSSRRRPIPHRLDDVAAVTQKTWHGCSRHQGVQSPIIHLRSLPMPNPFVHCELTSADPDSSKRFYSSLFDWKLEDVAMGDGSTYTMIKVGEG